MLNINENVLCLIKIKTLYIFFIILIFNYTMKDYKYIDKRNTCHLNLKTISNRELHNGMKNKVLS